MEGEWATLQALQDDIQNRMTNKKHDDDTAKTTFSQLELLITDPVEHWKNSDYETRQLLIMVWFG